MNQIVSDYVPHGPVLMTRERPPRRLTNQEVEAVVEEVKQDGLLVVCDRHQLSPGDVYRACTA